MPNLAGIWSPSLSSESLYRTLQTQLRRVRVPKVHYAEYREIADGFAAGLLDHGILENGPQPVMTEDGRKVLFLDGELYNIPELKRQFPLYPRRQNITAPELCLRLLVAHSEDVVEQFNGLFCLVVYDRLTHELTLISDRFGFRPLFYVQRNRAFVFGSELKALCVADPEARAVDEVGTLELFTYGSHFGDRTWLQDYLRLPPATILTVGANGVRRRTYWSYKYDEKAPTLDQATYYTAFGSLLERAVERSLKGSRRIGIFLSGGYDSRSVAAATPKDYLPLPAFTFGHPESRDVKYAQMLADRIGLNHQALTDGSPYLYANCRSIIWRTEGMNSFANCTSLRYHRRLKEQVDIILLGFLGEFSGSHTWPRLLLAKSRQAAISAIFDRMVTSRLPLIRRIFNREFFSTAFEALRERFKASFRAVQNDHPLNIADSWNFRYLQPRGTFQSPCVDRHLFEARAPHMDADLVRFLLTIPPYSRLEQRVYKKMIAYRFPEIRDVPCVNSGLPIDPNFAREYTMMLVRFLSKKASAPIRRLFRLGQPLGREFRDISEDFRAEPELIDNILRPLLDAEIFPSGVFNHSSIEGIITQHYEGKIRHDAILSMLISWGLAVKYFLNDDLSDAPADMYVPPNCSADSIAEELSVPASHDVDRR